MIGGFAAAVIGCIDVAPTDAPADAPADTALVLPSARAYADACADRLGPTPPLSCADVPEVPQTMTSADGAVRVVRSAEDLGPDGTCDRPSLLSGCAPGSRAGAIPGADGTLFYLLCRVRSFGTPAGLYDDLALIGRSDADGATCMWGAPQDGGVRTGDPLPIPGDEGSDDIWAEMPELAATACRSCHDGTGILTTPWIATNLPPHAVDGDMILPFAAAFAAIEPSWNGTPAWVHPDAAPCTTCHALTEGPACTFGPAATGRVPDRLSNPALARWPTDRWMDDLDPAVMAATHVDEAGWEAVYGAAADRLLACCGGRREGCWADPADRGRP